jgi:hypothetical protein
VDINAQPRESWDGFNTACRADNHLLDAGKAKKEGKQPIFSSLRASSPLGKQPIFSGKQPIFSSISSLHEKTREPGSVTRTREELCAQLCSHLQKRRGSAFRTCRKRSL